jgi:hypothetical protein
MPAYHTGNVLPAKTTGSDPVHRVETLMNRDTILIGLWFQAYKLHICAADH